MSRNTVEEVVGRLMLDAAFREQMAVDRVQALASYDLTDEERATLMALDLDTLESGASTLDQRVSKAVDSQ